MSNHVLVLSGGGALGSIQIACVNQLVSQGLKFDKMVGVSAGAINAAGISMLGVAQTLEYWRSIHKQSDVLGSNWYKLPWAKGIYNLRPLRKTLQRALFGKKATTPFWMGYVDLSDASITYEKDSDDFDKLINAIIASSSIPGWMEYYAGTKVDGGVRDTIPLEFAIKTLGATEVTVVCCQRPSRTPYWAHDGWKPRFPEIVTSALRAIDILTSELSWNDLQSKVVACNVPVRIYGPQVAPPLEVFDFDYDHISAGIEFGNRMAFNGPMHTNS